MIEAEARGTVIAGNTFVNMESDVERECTAEAVTGYTNQM